MDKEIQNKLGSLASNEKFQAIHGKVSEILQPMVDKYPGEDIGDSISELAVYIYENGKDYKKLAESFLDRTPAFFARNLQFFRLEPKVDAKFATWVNDEGRPKDKVRNIVQKVAWLNIPEDKVLAEADRLLDMGYEETMAHLYPPKEERKKSAEEIAKDEMAEKIGEMMIPVLWPNESFRGIDGKITEAGEFASWKAREYMREKINMNGQVDLENHRERIKLAVMPYIGLTPAAAKEKYIEEGKQRKLAEEAKLSPQERKKRDRQQELLKKFAALWPNPSASEKNIVSQFANKISHFCANRDFSDDQVAEVCEDFRDCTPAAANKKYNEEYKRREAPKKGELEAEAIKNLELDAMEILWPDGKEMTMPESSAVTGLAKIAYDGDKTMEEVIEESCVMGLKDMDMFDQFLKYRDDIAIRHTAEGPVR